MVTLRSDFATQSVILSGGVVLPLKWTEVGKVIGTALGNGSDVVNFPAIDGRAVSVFAERHPGTTLVLTILGTVVTWYGLSLVPNLKNKIIFHIFN